MNAPSVSVVPSGVSIGTQPSAILIQLAVDTDLELELWQPSRLTVEPSEIHLFDPGTGRSLLASSQTATGLGPRCHTATRATT